MTLEKAVNQMIATAYEEPLMDVRQRLFETFYYYGFNALMVGKDTDATAPNIVVFDNGKFANIYILDESDFTKEALAAFKKKADSFSWEHDASAHFVPYHYGRDKSAA